jgi:hypothetical protein
MHRDQVLNKAKTRRLKQCLRCSVKKAESNKKTNPVNNPINNRITSERKRQEREAAAQLQPNILSPLRDSAEIVSIASTIVSSSFLGQFAGTPASVLIFASRQVWKPLILPRAA